LELDQLGDPVAAGATFGELLVLEPDSPVALAALERVHRASGDGRALAGILVQKAAIPDGAEGREAALAEAARLYQDLGDRQAALATWRGLLEQDEASLLGHEN